MGSSTVLRPSSGTWILVALLVGLPASAARKTDDALRRQSNELTSETNRKSAIKPLPGDFVPNMVGWYRAACWFTDRPDSRGKTGGFFKARIEDNGDVLGASIPERDLEPGENGVIGSEDFDLREADTLFSGKLSGRSLSAVGRDTLFTSYEVRMQGQASPKGDGTWRGSGNIEGVDLDDPLWTCQGEWGAD